MKSPDFVHEESKPVAAIPFSSVSDWPRSEHTLGSEQGDVRGTLLGDFQGTFVLFNRKIKLKPDSPTCFLHTQGAVQWAKGVCVWRLQQPFCNHERRTATRWEDPKPW